MKKNNTCKIVIATHKQYDFPQDECYLPIHVGRVLGEDIGIQGDNVGVNISSKNPYYCELTGLYWAWRNLSYDFVGLAHYRRHFCIVETKDKFNSILTMAQVIDLISNNEIILPKKRKYYITNIYQHYARCHAKEHLDAVEVIIKKEYPSYHESYKKVINKRSAFMFNMFIMRKDILDEYCSWLFDILEKLEHSIEYKTLSDFDKRLFGRVSERLFNVWLENFKKRHPEVRVKEINFLYFGNVNYYSKITGFLKAIFLKKKYKKSF